MARGIYIHDNDNDRFSVDITDLMAQDQYLDSVKADIVAYIKTRAAQIPGAGTIIARETVEVINVI